MIVTFRPIKAMPPNWKPASARRPYSPFSSTYTSTMDLLQKELRHLKARSAFIQVDLRDHDRGVRLDGQLRSGALVDHPGVILTIETAAHGTLVYPCDAFSGRSGRPAWQENLRAVALGLEALRRVERYGIAERGQQYAGFRELGSGTEMGGATQTREQVARYLATMAGWATDTDLHAVLNHPGVVDQLYRQAAMVHHPDHGGDQTTMAYITAARDHLLDTMGS